MGEVVTAAKFLRLRLDDERRRFQKTFGADTTTPVGLERMGDAIRARAHIFRLQSLADAAKVYEDLQ